MTLDVVLTQTYKQEPLAIVKNLPGMDADLRPERMRAIARALLQAADDCEARPMAKRSFFKVQKSYPIVD